MRGPAQNFEFLVVGLHCFDHVSFKNQVDVSRVTLASTVQSCEDYLRNLHRHAKEYNTFFVETPLNARNVNISSKNVHLEVIKEVVSFLDKKISMPHAVFRTLISHYLQERLQLLEESQFVYACAFNDEGKSYKLIEQIVKILKCHRNILDQESKYLNALTVKIEVYAHEMKKEKLSVESEVAMDN